MKEYSFWNGGETSRAGTKREPLRKKVIACGPSRLAADRRRGFDRTGGSKTAFGSNCIRVRFDFMKRNRRVTSAPASKNEEPFAGFHVERAGAPVQLSLFVSTCPAPSLPPSIRNLAPPSCPEPQNYPSRADRGLPRGASKEDAASLEILRSEYERLRRVWNIGPSDISLSGRRLTGGVINYGSPHRIRISAHMTHVERLETLRHEIAHAVCWTRDGNANEGHGSRFWTVARALGVERRSAPETEALRRHREAKAIHVYRCEGCGAEWNRARPFRRSMLCASCHKKRRPCRLRKIRRSAEGSSSTKR